MYLMHVVYFHKKVIIPIAKRAPPLNAHTYTLSSNKQLICEFKTIINAIPGSNSPIITASNIAHMMWVTCGHVDVTRRPDTTSLVFRFRPLFYLVFSIKNRPQIFKDTKHHVCNVGWTSGKTKLWWWCDVAAVFMVLLHP